MSDSLQTNTLIIEYTSDFIKNFCRTFQVDESFFYLLRVEIRKSESERIVLTPFVAGGELCFQLVIYGEGTFDRKKIDQYLSQIVFSAYVNRGQKFQAGETLLTVPEWLSLGYSLYQAKTGSGLYLDMIKPVYESRSIPGIERIIQSNSPASMGLTTGVWETFQWLVFRSIIRTSDGPSKILKIAMESAGQGEQRISLSPLMKALEITSTDEMEKWWSLEVSLFCENVVNKVKTVAQTEEDLRKILIFSLPAEGALSLDDTFIRYRTVPEIIVQLREKINALSILYTESSSEYRGIILRYQRLFQSLLLDRATPITGELNALAKSRQQELLKNQAITDYMNWFIITKTEPDGESFESLFHAYDKLENKSTTAEFIPLPPLKLIKAADDL